MIKFTKKIIYKHQHDTLIYVCVCMHRPQACSLTQLCPTLTPLTAACQALCPFGLSQQENWSGVAYFLSSGYLLLDPGIKLITPYIPCI